MTAVAKSIEVLEDSLSIDSHQLGAHHRTGFRKDPLDARALSAIISPPQKREGLLLDRNQLKNPDDLAGYVFAHREVVQPCQEF